MARAVLFDIDGTLVDSVDHHARAWQEALAHFGKEVPYRDVRSQIGKGGDQLLPVFLSEDELERFGEELSEYRTGLYQRNYLPVVKVFPEARELLARLKQSGTTIGLASSCQLKCVKPAIASRASTATSVAAAGSAMRISHLSVSNGIDMAASTSAGKKGAYASRRVVT